MRELIKKIPKDKFPSHIAIIMDGNRRWAKLKGYPSFYGHKKGVERVKEIVKAAKKSGVKYLTLYTSSTENWKRPRKEISVLMGLLKKAIKNYTPELKENDISLKIIGRIDEFPDDIQEEIKKSVVSLSKCSSMVLNLALNYGGRAEIVDSVNKCIADGIKKVEEKDISERLYTFPQPEPDLIIRTGAEFRLSNFLIWQGAYSEMFISNKYWPEFNENDLYQAILDYSKRERRMGR